MEQINQTVKSGSNIPDDVMKEFVRVLLPEIKRFYESEENRNAFEEWKRRNAETAKDS